MALQKVQGSMKAGNWKPGLKEALREKRALFGCAVNFGHPVPVEICGYAGFDWVFIHFEHGSVSVPQAEAMTLAARLSGAAPIWRLNGLNPGEIKRALDLGAEGVIIPHVKSAEDAEKIVEAAYYPPGGMRGLGCRRPTQFGVLDAREYFKVANESTVVCMMIEDREAIEDIERIVAVPGIDVFNIGTWDLSKSLGVPIETRHPKVLEAIDRVLAAALPKGITVGLPPESPEDAAHWMEKGVRFFESASAGGLMVQAATDHLRSFRSAVEGVSDREMDGETSNSTKKGMWG